MISFLKGELVLKTPTWIEVDVNGVGYGLHIPISTFDQLPDTGNNIRLSTYLHIREDIMALYGFFTENDRDLFIELISVSGIGPKIGLAMLSTMTPSIIRNAILEDNPKFLTTVPGIGRKTAERIILDLGDKMKRNRRKIEDKRPVSGGESSLAVLEDAVAALETLGYHGSDARKVLTEVVKGKEDLPLEQLIREGLNRMMK